jgi:hypothetical protein
MKLKIIIIIVVNKTAFPTTYVIRYEVPWKSYFLIGEFEEADQRHGLSPLEFCFCGDLWSMWFTPVKSENYVMFARELTQM